MYVLWARSSKQPLSRGGGAGRGRISVRVTTPPLSTSRKITRGGPSYDPTPLWASAKTPTSTSASPYLDLGLPQVAQSSQAEVGRRPTSAWGIVKPKQKGRGRGRGRPQADLGLADPEPQKKSGGFRGRPRSRSVWSYDPPPFFEVPKITRDRPTYDPPLSEDPKSDLDQPPPPRERGCSPCPDSCATGVPRPGSSPCVGL